MNRRRAVFAAAIATALTAPAARAERQDDDEAAARNRRLAERYFDEVWNRGQLDVLDELLTPSYVNHNPSAGRPPPGPDGLKPIVAALRGAFPDLHFDVQQIVATADAVAIHTVMRGTHLGDLFGLAPTGRSVEVDQINIERIERGKIAEHWRVTDELAMRRQLGLVA
jgi:steroid delta-isomerase-like uncharacterized protein